ncbi:MAG: DsrE family protein [Bacteroidales bacterium]
MMKKFLFLSLILISVAFSSIKAQSVLKATSLGIVIYSNDTETIWNALRLANYSKNQGDTVSIFLLGKGVELDNLIKSDNDLKEQSDTFLNSGGTILGCGTCLKSRNNNEPQVCKFSSLKDLYELIRRNKVVLTF